MRVCVFLKERDYRYLSTDKGSAPRGDRVSELERQQEGGADMSALVTTLIYYILQCNILQYPKYSKYSNYFT